ncbi:conserved hypothetical protein [Exiguobacterium sp. 8H]|uniref:hypothetical protein n=1 Tax=unclassified Exiguobacterium TaxID=2644629 RepID=UPI0012F16454|nr:MULTISPECIES: hypothetical protein [unclassified Exiguobacterium]VXB80966.1 conserved hypothetical protein [Exiguobacterium sp. 8H]VXB97288.1 conserved hypothetical protein [Exiguobacterium sp. 8A]
MKLTDSKKFRMWMLKFAIRNHHPDSPYVDMIFHSTPYPESENAYDFCEHQWYLTPHPDKIGEPIKDERYEMMIVPTWLIQELGWDGMYLYCKVTDKQTRDVHDTETVKLDRDFDKVLESGTVFFKVADYDEHGMIVPVDQLAEM